MQRKQAAGTSKSTAARPKGGSQGANHGGASRGGSRVEPSPQQDAARKEAKRTTDRSRA